MSTPTIEPANPTPAPEPQQEATSASEQIGNHKLKIKKPFQRACNEKDEKGKLCAGHLKRWFYQADTVEKACGDLEKSLGKNAELYRCEHCKTLYKPNAAEPKVHNVAGPGNVSVFGVTVPPKEEKK